MHVLVMLPLFQVQAPLRKVILPYETQRRNVRQAKKTEEEKESSLPPILGNYSSDFDTALLLNYFEDYCGNVKSYDFGYMLGELNFGFITFTDVNQSRKLLH